jgi:hypothetical protein
MRVCCSNQTDEPICKEPSALWEHCCASDTTIQKPPPAQPATTGFSWFAELVM